MDGDPRWVLFSASARRHFGLTVRLGLAYLGVSLLHALWDSMHGIALRLTLLFTRGGAYQRPPNGWIVQPTAEQARLFPIIEWTGLAVISAIGVAWLAAEWRAGGRVAGRPAPDRRAAGLAGADPVGSATPL